MKRIFSMVLAVMLVITLGALPAAAIEHERHFIEFTDAIGGQISLGEATVGVSYSYPFQTERCSGISEETLSFSSPELEELPINLSLTPAGAITGTPSAAGEYEFQVTVTGTCSEQPDTPVTGTVTCTLTVAEHAHLMTFDNEQMTPHEGSDADFDILDAVVGQPYSYQLKCKSCDHMSDIGFISEEDPDPAAVTKRLPDGLSFDAETGIISGTPEEGTEETYTIKFGVEGKVNSAGGELETIGDSANFRLVVRPAPVTITWRIPYTKQVVRGGSRNPGPQTFTLEIFDAEVSGATDQITIYGDTGSIDTTGAGYYPGHVSVTAPADALEEGFQVREKSGSAAHWTYSNAFYTIWPVGDDGSGEISDQFKIYEGDYDGVEGEGTERETMTFTNTYTYSPSRDRDDDDDDDYEPPVRETEEDKEPQPQKDEPKSNPSTGRGTTWDYLAYLFHKYFSWAA